MVTWSPGESKIGPGVYIRSTAYGPIQTPGTIEGVVGVVVRATWGPLAAQSVSSLTQVDEIYGTGLGTDLIREALYGGAREVIVSRVGSGGTLGTLTLQDTTATPVSVVRLDAKYVGARTLGFTIRDNLSDPTNTRELLVYEQVGATWTLRQTVRFAKGSGGGGEPAKLIAAIAASNSQWVTAVSLAAGNGILATVGTVTPASAVGTDPTTLSADYTTAFTPLEGHPWNVLAVDTVDTTIHAAAVAFIDRIRSLGLRRMAVLAEPTSVALATRQTDARAYNNEAIVYWGNGFVGIDGVTRDGFLVSGRVAGIIASTPYNRSITRLPVQGATSVVGELSTDQQVASINAGMGSFSTSPTGAVRVHYGITTFITPTADKDMGWSKIRRVRTRDQLLNRIQLAWDPMIGQVNNDEDGRAALQAAAQGIINEMITLDALISGTIVLDPARPPAGDSAWFILSVDDIDSGEKLYLTAMFRFSAPA